MGADGADREYLIATPREERRLAVRVPEQHGAVGDARERDSLDEVRSAECLACVVHSISLACMLMVSSDARRRKAARELERNVC